MHPDPHQQHGGWQNQNQPAQQNFGGQPFHQPHAQAHGITCPKCHNPSESVKSYTMMSFLIFVFVGAWWRTKRVVACAPCMRSELMMSSGINLFTANVLSPIVFIWHGVLFAMSYEKGHSADVINYLR